MKKELTIGLLTVALTVGLASMASAEDIEDQETDVDVTVDSVTQLDVRPSALSYDNVAPGTQVTSSEEGYEHVDIENIGSTRIREITAQATMPLDQPFGANLEEDGTTVLYDTGNFVQLSLETAQGLSSVQDELAGEVPQDGDGGNDQQVSHYVNRVEFFEENPPEYITIDTDAGGSDADHEVGRFREGDVEYFFQLSHEGAGSGTEDDEMELRIGRAPHTSTQLGTVDFEDGDFIAFDEDTDFAASEGDTDNYMILEDTSVQFVSFDTDSTEDYDGENLLDDQGVADFDPEDLEDHKVTEYDLYIRPEASTPGEFEEQPHILRTRFNTDPVSPLRSDDPEEGTSLNNLETGNAQQYILDSGSDNNQLQPGQNFPVNIGVELPQGVDQNAIQNGAVTFFASEGEES